VSLIFTPDGGAFDTARTEEALPLWYMKMLHVFVMTNQEIDLGIYCDRCDTALQGTNAAEDTYWKMECACRTYVGRNPQQGRRGDA
jgi:hypothetical protein